MSKRSILVLKRLVWSDVLPFIGRCSLKCRWRPCFAGMHFICPDNAKGWRHTPTTWNVRLRMEQTAHQGASGGPAQYGPVMTGPIFFLKQTTTLFKAYNDEAGSLSSLYSPIWNVFAACTQWKQHAYTSVIKRFSQGPNSESCAVYNSWKDRAAFAYILLRHALFDWTYFSRLICRCMKHIRCISGLLSTILQLDPSSNRQSCMRFMCLQ